MKTINGIVARCADLDELCGQQDDTALPNSCNWPADGAHLSITARAGGPRLLARERMPSP